MAVTERKQVLLVGDTTDENVSQVSEPTQPIGGTMHGLAKDLTFTGTGFYGVATNTALPAISGDVTEDETLTATSGTWQDNNSIITAYEYQWYADDVEIGGATASTYVLTASEVDAMITVGVVAVNAVGDSEEAVSAAVGPVVAAA